MMARIDWGPPSQTSGGPREATRSPRASGADGLLQLAAAGPGGKRVHKTEPGASGRCESDALTREREGLTLTGKTPPPKGGRDANHEQGAGDDSAGHST